MDNLTILGFACTIFCAYRFVILLGKTIPIIELTLLICSLQWFGGPYLNYLTKFGYSRYNMYVDQDTYFGYIVPALTIMIIVSEIFQKRKQINISDWIDYRKAGIYLVIVGISADLLMPIFPSALRFLLVIFSFMKYSGAILLFFSKKKSDNLLFYLSLIYLFSLSLASGLFHDFLLWGIIFFMFWCIKIKPSIPKRLAIISMGIFMAMIIQTTKAAYREITWNGYKGNKLELFIKIASEQLSNGIIETDDQQGSLNVRLNQGWIISAVMKNVPLKVPFAEGETIITAVESSLLPRFLISNKAVAGGRENFRKFTGLYLGDNTSMGISIIGEGYANFGNIGGIIFIGIWMILILLLWNYLHRQIDFNPIVLFLIPLIFFQAIK
ncbi:MAG: hypothetical protein KJ941_13320, partial [Bacteroidetes bacterium]|nr:hypothetical protein [Bacteroidota bacterium]